MGFLCGTSGTRTHLPVQETQETGIRSLGQEDDFREVMATHFSVLAWRAWRARVHRITKSHDIGPCKHKNGNRNTNGQFRYDNSKNC